MTTNTIDEATRARLRAALLSPDLHIGSGLGSDDGGVDGGERCTIAEINMVLTGELDDGPHPCVSEVVRRWVIRVQDAMPDEERNAPAWRSAAVGIAGSAAGRDVEQRRRDLLLAWMWERLGDEAVLAALPESARSVWMTMLAERTPESCRAARRAAVVAAAAVAAAVAAAAAAAAVVAAVAAAAVVVAADGGGDGGGGVYATYWRRADCAGMLAKLVEVR